MKQRSWASVTIDAGMVSTDTFTSLAGINWRRYAYFECVIQN
jgi:hypothetical protein